MTTPTGWEGHMLQDECRELSQWLATKPGALRQALDAAVSAAVAAEREQCAAIVAGNYGWVNGTYYDDLADAVRGLPAPDGEEPPKPGA